MCVVQQCNYERPAIRGLHLHYARFTLQSSGFVGVRPKPVLFVKHKFPTSKLEISEIIRPGSLIYSCGFFTRRVARRTMPSSTAVITLIQT